MPKYFQCGVPRYPPTGKGWQFQFFYILANIFCSPLDFHDILVDKIWYSWYLCLLYKTASLLVEVALFFCSKSSAILPSVCIQQWGMGACTRDVCKNVYMNSRWKEPGRDPSVQWEWSETLDSSDKGQAGTTQSNVGGHWKQFWAKQVHAACIHL